MLILGNGKNLSEYKAKLLEREIGLAEANITTLWADEFINPFVSDGTFKWRTLRLSIELKGNNQFEIELNKSRVHANLQDTFITFSDMGGWRFYVVMSGAPTISETHNGKFQTVTYSLLSYIESESVELWEFEAGNMANRQRTIGNEYADMPVEIEFTTTSTTANIIFNGESLYFNRIGNYKITNDGRVLFNGANGWEYATIKKFPVMKAGINRFSKNDIGETIIRYRRRLK